MPGVNRSSFAFLLVLAAVLALPSCSSLNLFKGDPAGTHQGEDQNLPGEPVRTDNTEKAADIEALEKKIVLLEDKVKRLESRLAGQKKVVYTIEYSDPAQLYQQARTLLLANQPKEAADLFSTFVEKHPDHSLADNALYWLGECYYTRGNYSKTVEVFKKLVTTYPKAGKVPDALLKTGYAYLSLDEVNLAGQYFKQVIRKYPFSPAAEKAQTRLKELQ